MINERVQGCIADTLTFHLDGLLMRGIVRWQELHALAELHKWECVGPVSGTKSAHPGQAACP